MGERKRDLDWTHTTVIRGIDRMEHSGEAGTWLDRRVGAGGVALRQAGWRQFNRVGIQDSPTVALSFFLSLCRASLLFVCHHPVFYFFYFYADVLGGSLQLFSLSRPHRPLVFRAPVWPSGQNAATR